MPYVTLNDLLAYRPELALLGSQTWAAQLAETERILTRALDVQWYRRASEERGLALAAQGMIPTPCTNAWRLSPFDPAKLLDAATEIKPLARLKALELVYKALATGLADDPYLTLGREFEKQYGAELEAVLAAGPSYDWDASGQIDPLERHELEWPAQLVRQ